MESQQQVLQSCLELQKKNKSFKNFTQRQKNSSIDKFVATGGDDGQIYLSEVERGEPIQQISSYLTKNIPINSLCFNQTSELLAAGLGDGFVKLWELTSREARSFKPSTIYPQQSVTSVCFNSNFKFIGASNNQGFINIFPNNKNQMPNNSPQEEVFYMKNSEASVNQIKFSPLLDSIIASAQEDAIVAIYDLNNKQQKPHLTFNKHKAGVRGIAFSPLNKLLLSSISLDKSIFFYDINKGQKVSGLVAPESLQSISFNIDGHTVAVGSSISGNIYVYDLRNQNQILATLAGHSSTVNSINFKNSEKMSGQRPNQTQSTQQTNQNTAQNKQQNKPITIVSSSTAQGIQSPKDKTNQQKQSQNMNQNNAGGYMSNSGNTQFKTMEQIREEAKRNVEMKKQQKEMERIKQQQILEKETSRTEMSERDYTERNYEENKQNQPQVNQQIPQINLLERKSSQQPATIIDASIQSQKKPPQIQQQTSNQPAASRLRMDINLTTQDPVAKSSQKMPQINNLTSPLPKQSPKNSQQQQVININSNSLSQQQVVQQRDKSPTLVVNEIVTQSKVQPKISVKDVEMKDESNQEQENNKLRIKQAEQNIKERKDYDTNTLNVEDQQRDFMLLDQQKNEIDRIVQSKFDQLKYDVQSMLNNFHIEIIRQFEVQKVSLNFLTDRMISQNNIQGQIDAILAEYLIEDDPEESDEDDYVYLQVQKEYQGHSDDDYEDQQFEDQYLS